MTEDAQHGNLNVYQVKAWIKKLIFVTCSEYTEFKSRLKTV